MLVGYDDLDVGMLYLVYLFLWRQMHFQSSAWVDTVCGCFHVTKQWYGYQSCFFFVHAVVTACECTLGCMNVVRGSALKAGSGRKTVAALGSCSKLHRQCTRPGAQLNEFHPHLMWWSLIRSFAAVGMYVCLCVCECVHVHVGVCACQYVYLCVLMH